MFLRRKVLKKKLTARWTAGALVLSMLLPAIAAGVTPGGDRAGFSDVQGHWAQDGIFDWTDRGFVKGYADGMFRPDDNISRAEFAALVNRVFGFQDEAGARFTDVAAGDWYTKDLARAQAAGYMTGYADGSMKPDAPISRQEVAVVLERLLELQPDESAAGTFADAPVIPAWSKGSIGAVAAAQYMSGYPGGTFEPLEGASRAETVVLLSRAAGKVISGDQVYGPAEGVEIVDGNLTVIAPGSSVRNLKVNGDLYLTAGIGEGNVTLDNVRVAGRTLIRGGGAHSVMFRNCQLGLTVVARKDGEVRVVATGSTRVGEVVVTSGARLEEENLTGDGFGQVTVGKAAGNQAVVQLAGVFNAVNIREAQIKVEVVKGQVTRIEVAGEAAGAQVAVFGGTVDELALLSRAELEVAAGTVVKLEIAQGAADTRVDIARAAVVTTMIANAGASVTGAGKIETATIQAENVKIEQKPANVTVTSNVSGASVGGKNISGGTATTSGSNSGGDSGGGSGQVTAMTLTGASVGVGLGSVQFDYDFASNGTPVTYATAQGAPYYLDPVASTVQLSDGSNTSNAVSLNALGLQADGTQTYEGMTAVQEAFGIEIGEGAAWIPTTITLNLKSKTSVNGKTVANPWTLPVEVGLAAETGVFAVNADREGLLLKNDVGQPIAGIALAAITGDLKFDAAGQYGSSITWVSSNPDVIEVGGSVIDNVYYAGTVHRLDENTPLTLTATVRVGEYTLTKEFAVTVLGRQPLPVTASDAIVILDQDGMTPSGNDNFWLLTITTGGTVRDGVYEGDLTVIGLPAGLGVTAAKDSDNNAIKVTVTGSAAEQQAADVAVSVVVKASAVEEAADVRNSAPVQVQLVPPGDEAAQLNLTAIDQMVTLAPGNQVPLGSNNTWVFQVNNGSVRNDVSANDLTVTGLPAGLDVTAAAGNGNTVVVTVYGSAASPLGEPAAVQVVFKASAVNEADLLDSLAWPVTIALADSTPPVVDRNKFSAIDNAGPAEDQLYAAAGAVGEADATVRAYPWTDNNSDGLVDVGELGSAIEMGQSEAKGEPVSGKSL